MSGARLMRPEFLSLLTGLKLGRAPSGFAHDRMRTQLGVGRQAFNAAAQSLEHWAAFDLGWVRVANSAARMEVGQIVAVQVHALGLWSLNLSQVVDVLRGDAFCGFLYKTTPHHIEEGEERFVLTLDDTGAVWYELEAVSRPRHLLARMGFPVAREYQHRFARDSHKRMRMAAVVKQPSLA